MHAQGIMSWVFDGLVDCSVFNSPIPSIKRKAIEYNSWRNTNVKSHGNGWHAGNEIYSQTEICESINLKLRRRHEYQSLAEELL
jgi:hypothetical protein